MDIDDVVDAYSQLGKLRWQLNNPPDSWTPKSLEDWHNAVQEALCSCEISKKSLDEFNLIPPGQLKTFAIVRDDKCSVNETHYEQSEVDDFLENGLEKAKNFLNSIIGAFEDYIKVHREEYDAAVKARIEKIIEQGPK